jgi:hypothetical protein
VWEAGHHCGRFAGDQIDDSVPSSGVFLQERAESSRRETARTSEFRANS